MQRTTKQSHNQSGAGLVEYGLLVALLTLMALPSTEKLAEVVLKPVCEASGGMSSNPQSNLGNNKTTLYNKMHCYEKQEFGWLKIW